MSTSVAVERRAFGEGAPGRVVALHTDVLDLRRVTMPSRDRAREAAHLLAGITGESSAALALPAATISARHAPSELRRDGPEHYLTLRAALGAWAARTGTAALTADQAPTPIGRYLGALRSRAAIATSEWRVDARPAARVVPIAGLAPLRHLGAAGSRALAVNSHFFLFDPRELDAPTAAFGEPVGLLAYAGRIVNPPVLPRAALVHAGGRWRVERLGLADLLIDLPGGLTVDAGDPRAARMRYRGDGLRDTEWSCTVEACLQGAHVSVLRDGGGVRLPHGALAIAFDAELPGGVRTALEAGARVRYRLRHLPDLHAALQGGPLLLRNGDVVVDAESFRRERFETLGSHDPTAPLVFPADADRTRAARVGIGVRGDGSLVVIAVEGRSSLSRREGNAANGCTLLELAEVLRDHGAVDALNLDGGGSAQVFHGNDAVLGSSDTRGDPHASFDRPVPVAVLARA